MCVLDLPVLYQLPELSDAMKLLVLACLVMLTAANQPFEELGEEIAQFAVDVLEFDDTIQERVKQADATHAEWSWFRSRINQIKGRISQN